MAKTKTPIVYLRDIPAGTLVVVRDRMVRPNESDPEYREIWYRREADDAPRSVAHPGFVPTTRLRTLQGLPDGEARYDSGAMECTDPGISHGMTPVVSGTILGHHTRYAFEQLLKRHLPLQVPAPDTEA